MTKVDGRQNLSSHLVHIYVFKGLTLGRRVLWVLLSILYFPFRSCTKSFSVSGQQRLIKFILLFIEVKNDFFLCPTWKYIILITMTGASVMTVEDKLLIISSPFNSFNKDTRKLWFQKHLFKSLGQVSGPCVWQRSSGLRQDADDEAREPRWSANSGSKDFHVSGKSMKIACSSHRFGRLNGSQWDLLPCVRAAWGCAYLYFSESRLLMMCRCMHWCKNTVMRENEEMHSLFFFVSHGLHRSDHIYKTRFPGNYSTVCMRFL